MPKVHGEVYVLPKDFLVNLSDGRFGKLNVALVFDHGFTAAPAAGGHGAGTEAPEGYGVLTQEPLVRAIVTDVLTTRRPTTSPVPSTATRSRRRSPSGSRRRPT